MMDDDFMTNLWITATLAVVLFVGSIVTLTHCGPDSGPSARAARAEQRLQVDTPGMSYEAREETGR